MANSNGSIIDNRSSVFVAAMVTGMVVRSPLSDLPLEALAGKSETVLVEIEVAAETSGAAVVRIPTRLGHTGHRHLDQFGVSRTAK